MEINEGGVGSRAINTDSRTSVIFEVHGLEHFLAT
jgi:hypothetical protein